MPNGFAFRGVVVLSPATPSDSIKDFEGLTLYEQETRLIGPYEASKYTLMSRGEEEVDSSVTVMGRMVGAQASEESEAECIEESERKRARR